MKHILTFKSCHLSVKNSTANFSFLLRLRILTGKVYELRHGFVNGREALLA